MILTFLVPFSGYIITIGRYLFILHRNVFLNFRLNGRPFSSYCCGNVNVMSWGSAMYPCKFHASFNALLASSACYWPVPGLFRLLLACFWLVPLVTGLFRLFRVLVTSIYEHTSVKFHEACFISRESSLPYASVTDKSGPIPENYQRIKLNKCHTEYVNKCSSKSNSSLFITKFDPFFMS